MTFGWNATAYQILNPGMEHWFSEDGQAVVGYVKRGRYLLAAGAPICAEPSLAPAARAFESFAHSQHRTACFVLAEERLLRLTESWSEHCSVVIGAQPAWNPTGWQDVLRRHRSLRAQLSRARNKHVTVEIGDAARCAGDPELRSTLAAWLQTRGLPPMRFLVEPNILDRAQHDRVVLVARRESQVVAFLVASPIVLRNGYLVELVARSPHAPNGSTELLIDAMIRFAGERGSAYVTLGLVALATQSKLAMASNPFWLRALTTAARAHANHFYNFRGLEHFRAKMLPSRWETVYIIANQRRFSPFALYAIGGAFSGISPVFAIALALVRALTQELLRGGSFLRDRLFRAVRSKEKG